MQTKLSIYVLYRLAGRPAPRIETRQMSAAFKGAREAEGEQKFCLNMVKKDQLCAIALLKRRQFF